MSDMEIIPTDEPNSKLLYPLLKDKKMQASSYRIKHDKNVYRTIHPTELDQYISEGWIIHKKGKNKISVKRAKSFDVMLEDRVWCLLYKMRYATINGNRFNISFRREDGSHGKKQIDAFACDDETALVVECKSKETRGRRTLQKDLHETICLQNHLRQSIYSLYDGMPRPKIIWIYVTNNIIWSEPDVDRALSGNIIIMTENELQYFETFIHHMGPAGKYQVVAEFLKGQKIPGLADVKVPAIKGKIGGEDFYYFATTPRRLLKIAFINHQALNHPDGRPAYQRMISANRIKEIGSYIKDGGFFPTNILVNFTESPKFELISNKENTDPNIKFGWISLPSRYRSAWIIDGQHRLYGYSHLDDEYLDQSLFVLAFEKMETKKEADLFITINHKQKTVPKSLLVSLLADLRLDSDDPRTAHTALASAIIRALNSDKTSPFFRRFALSGVPPESTQNLTIAEAVNGLTRSTLIKQVLRNKLIPGPLSDQTDEKTIERAKKIINGYFEKLREANPQRWEKGREAYISVNPGVRAHFMLMNEIVGYLRYQKSIDFIEVTEQDFINCLIEIASPIFEFISLAKDEQIVECFSRKFGEGGVKEYFYKLCELVATKCPDFGCEEFKTYVERKTDDRVAQADQLIINLTRDMTDYVIKTLKTVYGTHRMPSGDQAYWELGIESRRVRDNAYRKQQEIPSGPKRLPKEAYLDVIDIKEIIEQKNNWLHFESMFNIPMIDEKRGKKYYTSWIDNFNELRRIPAHKSALRVYSEEDFEFLEWLRIEFYDRLQRNK
jgi:DNA sulfur modification protein DndB